MDRDIWFVIDDMVDALQKLVESDIIGQSTFHAILEGSLVPIQRKAKYTAPEAMFLRWAELDRVVDWFLLYSGGVLTGYETVVFAYLDKWE